MSRMLQLWTVRSPRAAEVLAGRGVLRGDGRYVDPCFRPAYRWLIQQMKARVPGYSGFAPIWAWTHKPDMRRVQYRAVREPVVRMGFCVDPDRVLVSDFGAWHCVLNRQPVTLNEREWDESERWDRTQIEASWQRIFDPAVMATADPAWVGDNPPVYQATLNEIRRGDVFDIKFFPARVRVQRR